LSEFTRERDLVTPDENGDKVIQDSAVRRCCQASCRAPVLPGSGNAKRLD